MLNCYVTTRDQAILIELIPHKKIAAWIAEQDEFSKNWLVATQQMRWEAGTTLCIPNQQGKIARVVCCVNHEKDFWGVGHLAYSLPLGVYRFSQPDADVHFYLMWGLGAYQFTRYKKSTKTPAQLFLPSDQAALVSTIVESIYWVRDLINMPSEDMGPSEVGQQAAALAKQTGAKIQQIVGNDLLKHNFNSIYTVGRASDDPPRLIELNWGHKNDPQIVLVGKGVCFDSGGLDIKPATNMALMKKDMAGAAHVLGLAKMLMEANLPIQLRVLIPAVENVIASTAYRPGDVIKSRKGLSIEIGNTDAEGRVILADALHEASSTQPDLLIDLATLTGAARIALGTELAALFSNRDELAAQLLQYGDEELDPMWRLPLYKPYRELINSSVADLSNSSSDSYGGAITAALFLKEFVPDEVPWVHFDLFAWNNKTRPGRPAGGEAHTLRALFFYLKDRFMNS